MYDVKVLYWWQQVVVQGEVGVVDVLQLFMVVEEVQLWVVQVCVQLSDKLCNSNFFLSVCIELVVIFGLIKLEVLFIDIKQVDYGYCLVVDICVYYVCSKCCLIVVQIEVQCVVINCVSCLFGDVDCGFSGLEGNYCQCQYWLCMVFLDIV